MLVENQYFEVKWNARTRKWYEDKGYVFTRTSDVFTVKAEDLCLGSHLKVKVKCDYCGKIVDVAYKDYVKYNYDKYACAKCKGLKTKDFTLESRQNYLYNRVTKVCDDFGYNLLTKKENILDANTRIAYYCQKHGINNTKIYTLLLGHRCPECAKQLIAENCRHTIDDILIVGKENGVKIINPEDYVKWDKKNLKCVCQECGKIYFASYGALSKGKSIYCPHCSKSESIGERRVKHYLEEKNINFKQEKSFDDCRATNPLPFDFYLPDYNICIEYQGQQHYKVIEYFGNKDGFKKRKINDNIKKQYCKENNITLIEIPYWNFNNIEDILNKELFTQRYSLVS